MLESREWKRFVALNGNKISTNETNKAGRAKFSPEPLNIGFLPREFVRLQTFWRTFLHTTNDNQLRADATSVGDEGKW